MTVLKSWIHYLSGICKSDAIDFTLALFLRWSQVHVFIPVCLLFAMPSYVTSLLTPFCDQHFLLLGKKISTCSLHYKSLCAGLSQHWQWSCSALLCLVKAHWVNVYRIPPSSHLMEKNLIGFSDIWISLLILWRNVAIFFCGFSMTVCWMP